MLIAVNIKNFHRYGDVYPQILRLRYKQFKERQGYNVPVFEDMEFDQYDTPATTYLAFVTPDGRLVGTSRLVPTTQPYMLKELWPDMVDGELPCHPKVWEGTRICIDKGLPSEHRDRIKWEIVLGYLEFGLANGIERYIGVMQSLIWSRVFVQSGWGAEFLGPERIIDRIRTRAGQVHVSTEALMRVRATTGFHESVLGNFDRPAVQAA
jgi:acyl homoserine lactone synthase